MTGDYLIYPSGHAEATLSHRGACRHCNYATRASTKPKSKERMVEHVKTAHGIDKPKAV